MKTIKFLKIDKDNVLGVIGGSETNARISSFVEQVLTFAEVKFIIWDYSTSTFISQTFRGNVKELISKFALYEECLLIPEYEAKDNTEYLKWLDLLNDENAKVNETEEYLEITKGIECKFTIKHEEDGKMLFNRTVTNPDEIWDVLLEYYKKCHSINFDNVFSSSSISNMTDLIEKYLK